MKIVLIGANGTIGREVQRKLREAGHEVVPVGRSSGELRVNLEDRASVAALFRDLGAFDAVAVAGGEVAFKPLASLTTEDLVFSFRSKGIGQIHVVQEALPYIRDGGSFTLISGVTGREPIRDGAAAAAVSRAVEGFAMAAASELPRGLRVNVISPTVLAESMPAYGAYFAGHEPVSGEKVANAYLKAIEGRMNGDTIAVGA
jgi:NAD(P)-dependent dehydrogenase (short-subunit alcohol dehydrogenase family)